MYEYELRPSMRAIALRGGKEYEIFWLRLWVTNKYKLERENHEARKA